MMGGFDKRKPFVMLFMANSAADPTRSITLRKQFIAEMNKRFRILKGLIRKSIIDQDCFGLTDRPAIFQELPSKAFAYVHNPAKVEGFMGWLRGMEEQHILEITTVPGMAGPQPWANAYIRSAYQKGLVDARNKLIAAGVNLPAPEDIMGGGVIGAFSTPFHADRVALAYTRSYNDLKGITAAMDQQISRILARGLAEGIGPYEIARRLNDRVDKIGINRARTLARTETIKVLNDAAVNEFELAEMTINEPVYVRWLTARDERVRSSHRLRHGKVYTRDEGRRLTGEPNCRCALLPYIESVHGSVGDKRGNPKEV